MVMTLKEVFKDEMMGGFHIWPKRRASEKNRIALTSEEESEILKELFEEEFA